MTTLAPIIQAETIAHLRDIVPPNVIGSEVARLSERGISGPTYWAPALVQGSVAPADGGGGLFFWSPSSVADDDGLTVVKPTLGATQGRWIRGTPAILSAAQTPTTGVYPTGTVIYNTDTSAGAPLGWTKAQDGSWTSFGKNILSLPSPPSSGTYAAGTLVLNSNPVDGAPAGWTMRQDGSWAPFGAAGGAINAAPQQYTVAVNSPAGGSAVSGTIPIQVQTAGMADVEIYNGTAFLIHAAVPAGGITTLNLDTSLLPNGANTLTVKAQDTAFGTTPAHTAQASLALTVNNGTGNVSADGTTIPGAAQIVDDAGNVWTLSGGVVNENGAAASFSAGVTLLLWYGGRIYQTNGTGWWVWDAVNKAWVASSDPRPASGAGSSSALPTAIASTSLSLAYDLSSKIANGTLSIASNASTSAADLYGGLWYETGFDGTAGHTSLSGGVLSLNSSFNLTSCDKTGTHGFVIPAMSSLTADGYYVEFTVAYNALGGDGSNAGHPGMGVWLEGVNHISGTYPASEQDVHEDYGTSASPGNFVATLHNFATNGSSSQQVNIYDNPGQDTSTYHKYAMWAKAGVRRYYLDDVEIPNSPLTPYSVNDTDQHFIVLTAEGPISPVMEVLRIKSVKVWK